MIKTVDCFYCENLSELIQEDNNNLLSKIIQHPKCKLGRRIKIKMPKNYYEYATYPRKCELFKNINK